jgi:PAS domain S-box-containing protein
VKPPGHSRRGPSSVTLEARPGLYSGLAAASRITGIAVALVGVAVLVGWLFHVGWLTGLLPHLATMKPNTALGFLLAGVALSLQAPQAPDRRARRLAQGCALVVVLIAVLTLVEYAAGRNLGIDELLFADRPGGHSAPFPGRMGANTALNFLLLGLALLGLDVETRGGQRPAQLLALAGGAVAVIALIGYLYSVTAFYGIASYTQMALHTAGTFVMLAAGVLIAHPDRGVMATMTSAAPGGLMARRFLPAALGVPLALGWLRLEGQRAGWYGTEIGLSLMVMASIATFTLLAWWSAVGLNRADAARRESEARNTAILEAALDGIVTIDHRGLITEFNPAAERTFGYRRVDVRGREMAALLIPPALRDRHREGFARYLATGEGPVIGQRLELTAIRANGSEFPIELTITRLPSDGPPMFTGFVRDITEHKQAQEAVARYTERLGILHEIDQAVIAAETPIAIAEAVLWRLRDLLGVPRAIVNLFDLAAGEVEWLAAVGRRRMYRGPGVRYALQLAGDLDALGRGEPQVIDVRSLPLSPEAEALLASGVHTYMVVPMIAGGELIGSVSFGGDRGQFSQEQISIAQEVATQLAIAIAQARLHERVKQQAEELEQRVRERTAELEAAQEALVRNERLATLGHIAGGVSHELRNPLGVIKNSVYYLKMVLPEDARARKHLAIVEREIAAADRIVTGLLDFARVSPANREAMDLNETVREYLARKPLPDNIVLVTTLADALPPVRADAGQIELILGNLVTNAIQAMPEGGRLTVETVMIQDGVRLTVADTGKGISPDDLEKIFEPLFTTKAKGIGLGLSVARRLALTNGATIAVESAPGRGSRFAMHFTSRA